MAARIKIVEDDRIIRDFVRDYLADKGYEVVSYPDATSFKDDMPSRADLIVMDLSLPDMDGYDLARFVRLKSNTPIIMLTARDITRERLLGFDVGADDYVTKPFAVSELFARIRNILRRMGIKDSERRIAFEGFSLDLDNMNIDMDGQSVKLTKSEFRLFKLLLERRSEPVSRSEIFLHMKGRKPGRDERSVDVLIMRLRSKLPDRMEIRNVRGKGYMLGFC